jgi:hypothetical protein
MRVTAIKKEGNGVRSFIITRNLRCFAFNRPKCATKTVFCRKSATLRLLHSPIAHARAYGTTHLFSHCQHRKSHGFGSFGIASSIGGSPPDATDGTRKVTAPPPVAGPSVQSIQVAKTSRGLDRDLLFRRIIIGAFRIGSYAQHDHERPRSPDYPRHPDPTRK